MSIDYAGVKAVLARQEIELASWAFGNSGTRFKVFVQPGVPRDPFEKLTDAAQVHRYTGVSRSCRCTSRGTRSLSRRRVSVVHLVGGGARNKLLCQLTADAADLPVIAGPAEATGLGNTLVQARAAGVLGRGARPGCSAGVLGRGARPGCSAGVLGGGSRRCVP